MYINDIENVLPVFSILGQISPHTESHILLALTDGLQVVLECCLFGAQTL